MLVNTILSLLFFKLALAFPPSDYDVKDSPVLRKILPNVPDNIPEHVSASDQELELVPPLWLPLKAIAELPNFEYTRYITFDSSLQLYLQTITPQYYTERDLWNSLAIVQLTMSEKHHFSLFLEPFYPKLTETGLSDNTWRRISALQTHIDKYQFQNFVTILDKYLVIPPEISARIWTEYDTNNARIIFSSLRQFYSSLFELLEKPMCIVRMIARNHLLRIYQYLLFAQQLNRIPPVHLKPAFALYYNELTFNNEDRSNDVMIQSCSNIMSLNQFNNLLALIDYDSQYHF
ncbi:MAG: hypothetical protein EOP45_06655 [Sphingobacteriaceae bacterium]|nr:MAG: hypothetical protein EOP45_06655 [Sphingobacteriaceae bacterium]